MSDTTPMLPFNPMLLNPSASTQDFVQALPAMTAPLQSSTQDTYEYYLCTMLNHHMHRTDGKRMIFLYNVYATNDVEDIKYLDKEIKGGNPFIRKAADNEVQLYKMRVDPKGTMAAEMRPNIEAEVRSQLDGELKKALLEKLQAAGITLTPEQKMSVMETVPTSVSSYSVPSDVQDASGGTLLSGVDRLAMLKANQTVTRTDGATVLQGIVGSDRTVNSATSIG